MRNELTHLHSVYEPHPYEILRYSASNTVMQLKYRIIVEFLSRTATFTVGANKGLLYTFCVSGHDNVTMVLSKSTTTAVY